MDSLYCGHYSLVGKESHQLICKERTIGSWHFEETIFSSWHYFKLRSLLA